MQLSKYVRCTANGKWKFRRSIPEKFREIFSRRELKFTLTATDVYEVIREALVISQNFDNLLHNIEMAKQDKKVDLSLTQLVTVGGFSKNKDGTVSIQDLSFDAKDPKDREEVASLLNLLREPTQKSVYSTPQVNQFKLSQALALNRTARNLNPSALKKLERAYQLAFDVIGDIDLNGPGAKAKMTELLVAALKEPARRSQIKELKGLTYLAQVKYAEKHNLPLVNPATTTNLLNFLSSSIEVVMELDNRLTQNPLSYTQTAKVVGQPPKKNKHIDDMVGFTQAEMGQLFDAKNLKLINSPDVLLGALIGLHTGMRVNEVASLHLSHIIQKDGIYCFDLSNWVIGIKPANRGKACLKTQASQRLIPLSKGLLDAGILEYAALVKASGSERLLPSMSWDETGGYGRVLSRSFVNYRKKLGIVDGKDFHELRATLNDSMKQAGISQEFREDLVGHSNKSMNSHSYTNPTGLANLQKAVNAIKQPKIKISDYFDENQLPEWFAKCQKKNAQPKIVRKKS